MSESTITAPSSDDVLGYYREKATVAAAGGCCGSAETGLGAQAYEQVRPGEVPDMALLASLGCGNPTAVAELREGETILDLGSGAGLDLILSARRVGPDGLVYGLDALEEMLAVARRNIDDAEIENIVLLKGDIESIPLPAETLDVIISNCVINLALDKAKVIHEIARVLVPGGRIGISDVVADDRLSPQDRAARGGRSECVAGALSVSEYRDLLAQAGLQDVSIDLTQEPLDGIHSAIIRGRKPTGGG